MKKLAIAMLVSGAMALPAMAQTFPNPAGYDTKGQCQAALMKARNNLRQNPETRHPNDTELTNKEFNQATAQNWECQEQDGRWYARFVG